MAKAARKQNRQDERDELWTIVADALGGSVLDPEADTKMDELITKGIDRVKLDRTMGSRWLEAQENYRLLGETLRKDSQDVRAKVTLADIEKALKKLCPIYPIC